MCGQLAHGNCNEILLGAKWNGLSGPFSFSLSFLSLSLSLLFPNENLKIAHDEELIPSFPFRRTLFDGRKSTVK